MKCCTFVSQMQKLGTDSIKGELGISHSRSGIISRFIGLLFVLILLQQSSPIFSLAGLSSSSVSTTSSANRHTFSEFPLPDDQAQDEIEMAVEVTEEDDLHHDVDHIFTTTANKSSLQERLYTSFINSRYQTLASSLYSKVEVPYFILHHSWRNHIS